MTLTTPLPIVRRNFWAVVALSFTVLFVGLAQYCEPSHGAMASPAAVTADLPSK